jgi:hypothetical protein
VEFCLVSRTSANRWEFPKAETGDGHASPQLLLQKAADGAGLAGQLERDEPFDGFVSARGSESRSVTAYLMRVTRVDNDWPQQSSHRRLWCLAEEARARLRRKPFRRFVDRALRLVGAGPSNGNTASSDAPLPRKPR